MIRVNLLALDDNDLGDFQPYPTTLFIALIGWHPTGGDEASPSLVPTLRGELRARKDVIFSDDCPRCLGFDLRDVWRMCNIVARYAPTSLEASPCGAPGARMIFMPSAYSWLLGASRTSRRSARLINSSLAHLHSHPRLPRCPAPLLPAREAGTQGLSAPHASLRTILTPFTAPLTHLSPTLPARMLDPDFQRAPREQGTTSPAEPDFHRPRCLCADVRVQPCTDSVSSTSWPSAMSFACGCRITARTIRGAGLTRLRFTGARFRFRLDQRRSTHVALEVTPDDAIRLPHWRDCHLGFDVTEAIRTRHLLPRRICRYSDPSGNAGTRGLLPSASARTITPAGQRTANV
ncbi:hypothetical protein B0H10DRAFT_2249191 [Mycena sp. CBHHK59/15]|nr:hypothetical protein B0H10DRAFT_2249191 [Mycena sp. CBHHK59/15]